MAGPARQLLVMRHAHALPQSPDQSDVDRSLSQRGVGDARRRADVVRAFRPQLVICSAANRATQTMESLEIDGATVLVEEEVYEADAFALGVRLSQINDDVTSAIVIGHLPTVQDLVRALVPDPDEVPGFRPAALAVLSTSGGWADQLVAGWTLDEFHD